MVTYSTPQTINCKKGDHLLSEGDHLLQSRLSPGTIYFRGPFTLWQIYTHLLQEYSPWQLPGSPSSLQISLAPKISGDSLKIIYTRSTLYAYPYNMLCKRLIQIQLRFLTQKFIFWISVNIYLSGPWTLAECLGHLPDLNDLLLQEAGEAFLRRFTRLLFRHQIMLEVLIPCCTATVMGTRL